MIAATFVLAFSSTFVVTSVSFGATVAVFDQGFEANKDGIVEYPGPVNRVASGDGVLGVPSADGAYHAEVTLSGTDGDGFYTTNGGYSPDWPGYIKQSIKVYIDPAAGAVDDGYWWDAAISKDGGGWAAGGGFGVRKTDSDTWSLGAEDAYGGFHYVGNTRPPHDNTMPLDITSAGWYTLATEWVQSTGDPDLIDQVNTVHDSDGNRLWIDTIPEYISQTADGVSKAYKGVVAGGMSYSWLGSQASNDGSGQDLHPYEDGVLLDAPANTMTTLAIDDVYAEIESGAPIPEPAGLGLLGLGLLGVVRRRKRS
jgi:MYXO-CTERM domain-containing protein